MIMVSNYYRNYSNKTQVNQFLLNRMIKKSNLRSNKFTKNYQHILDKNQKVSLLMKKEKYRKTI
jgi:hypothetical protein